jgi:polyhydroxybutyrate depolymerase
MSFKLACDAADAIAAVAPVDFDCITSTADTGPSCAMCNPSRPITEIQFRATGDALVPYNGGRTPVAANCPPGGQCSAFNFPGAPTNLTNWGQLNMCTGTPAALPSQSACQQFPMCAGGVETVLCTTQGGSHCGNYQNFGGLATLAWGQLQKFSLP